MYNPTHAATVTKVSNGYIVEISRPMEFVENKNSLEEQMKLIKSFAKMMRKEDQIENLRLEEQQETQAPKKPESNIHIFKTFEEVAEFLEYHFEKE